MICKLCVYARRAAGLPPDLASQPRYSESALLDHFNISHSRSGINWAEAMGWKTGTIQKEARGIAAGFAVYYGDVMTRSWYILWCLHCDHETSDPFAIDAQSCPKCGRNYSGVL